VDKRKHVRVLQRPSGDSTFPMRKEISYIYGSPGDT